MRHPKVAVDLNADAALVAALELLAKRGKKLTSLRRWILKLLCREPRAIGAYALVSAVAKEFGRQIAPQTVYRTLDFLEEQGLVAHLLSTRTYVARSRYNDEKTSVFFVCSRCGITAECRDAHVERAVRLSADAIEFIAPTRVIDLPGVCKPCSLASKVTKSNRRSASRWS